ncbi:MAG: hypothetical protein CVU56_19980 [Deltaproteobacteria bacterium HGW-Deltaproteobacteria-14]|nr:MAG: hypothetical protein CVU56_19980 [Deltaproteobacteria bacterium HGW-Deltaproteobacteria-14]
MKTKIGFSIYLNGKLIREIAFDRPIVNVGKLSTSNLRLDDINVSRKHAVIEQRENGQWRITDLGSTNGTIVRGERVVQGDLHDGDRLVLGTTTLIVHLDDEAVAGVERREEAPKIEVAGSGTAGGQPLAAKGKGKRPAKPTGEPVPAEEIRGLGEDSFYKKKEVVEATSTDALEVALLWGETVLAVETFEKPQSITVGEAKGCRFALPQSVLGGMAYELVRAQGGRFVLDVTNPNLKGDLLVDGGVKSVEEIREGGGKITLDQPIRARLHAGKFTLLVSYGQAPTKPGVGSIGRVDVDAWIYISISAIVHIAFLVVLSLLPTDLNFSERDPRALAQRAIEVLRVEVKPEEEEKKKKEEEEEKKKNKTPGEDEKDKGEDKMKVDNSPIEVERPDKDPQKLTNKLIMEKKREREAFNAMSEEDRKKKAEQMVQQTSTNQAFQNTAFNDLLNTDPDLNNRKPLFRALSSRADDGAEGANDFAQGSIDPFGGSLGPGPGGFQTEGGGPGGPSGPGGPAIAGVLDGKNRGRNLNDLDFNQRAVDPQIIQMPVRLTGELDAKTVQQYIRRYLSGIKWCYQDRLQSNRNLSGKLTLAFTILPNGSVLDPTCKNSTLGDEVLHKCISNKMSRWKFPSPKDGGLVEVQYPIILKTQ